MVKDPDVEFDAAGEAALMMRCVQLLSEVWPVDQWRSRELIRRASRLLVSALSGGDPDLARADRQLDRIDRLLHLSLRMRYADPRHLAVVYAHLLRLRGWMDGQGRRVEDAASSGSYRADGLVADAPREERAAAGTGTVCV